VPEHVPVVIAVGYKSEQVKACLSYIFPNREIEFVDIENFAGTASGPGLSLLGCKEYLQCPFILLGADTLVSPTEHVLIPNKDWIGVGSCSRWCDNTGTYCLYDEEKGFYYGEQKGGWEEWDNCFIGLAGINDYEKFWQSLEDTTLIEGEHQILNGFTNLQSTKIKFESWRDTGNNMSYSYARKEYEEVVEPKSDEAIYIDGSKVMKYFDDAKKAADRILRSDILQPYVPPVIKLDSHIYGYEYIPGTRFSDLCNVRLLASFFDFVRKMYLDTSCSYNEKDFRNNCTKMYQEKTYDRVRTHDELDRLDSVETINGKLVRPIHDMLDEVDWDNIVESAIPVVLHGDMSPENIIYDSRNGEFILIDWRDRFGGDLHTGDVYYDLCKLDHALLVNGEVVRKKRFKVSVHGVSSSIEIDIRSNLVDARRLLESFCNNNGLDFEHVKLLTALTLLNISSVHSDKSFNRFLFLYGKLLLSEALN